MKNSDPVVQSFCHTQLAMELRLKHVEYASKFDEIAQRNSNFVVDMLDLCQNQCEAELLLSNRILPNKSYFDKRLPLPILECALTTKNYKFVAHDYSQETLREKMYQSDNEEDILPYSSTKMSGRILYVIVAMILMPIFVFFHIFYNVSLQFIRQTSNVSDYTSSNTTAGRCSTRTKPPRSRFHIFFTFFSFPLNRCLGWGYSFAVMMILTLLMLFFDDDINIRILILLFSITSIISLLKNIRYLFFIFFSKICINICRLKE